VEILKQPQYQPMEVEKQVLVIWAATNGYLDDVPVDQVRRFESELLRFVENSHPGVLAQIREKKQFTDEIKDELKQLFGDFKASWEDKAFNPQPDPPRIAETTAATPAAAPAAAGD
jgi:F-type H+-transporting ATPase subunit alpha